MKHTKIVCTIGPSSQSKDILRSMMEQGMDVCRLNFSHGTYENHRELIKNIRKTASSLKKEVAILQDLQGPRIRLGILPDTGLEVKAEDKVVLVGEKASLKNFGSYKVVPIQYEELYLDVNKGDVILIEDGTKKLLVEKIEDKIIKTKVIIGGILKSHKGINVPGVSLKAEVITVKDKEDLKFGLSEGVDYVALSFVKNGQDIKDLRKLINKFSSDKIQTGIIAKIEREEALSNLDEIVNEADGIMVARGDLGIEIPTEQVPVWQKNIIYKCLLASKPVIVATQMMDSMIKNPQPTRAEVSDVANAVIDHTDAVMLSGESASGGYPVETVSMMGRTIMETENSRFDDLSCFALPTENKIDLFFSRCLCLAVKDIKISAAFIYSSDGILARILRRYRPELDLVVFTDSQKVARQIALYWGCRACFISSPIVSLLDLEKEAKKWLKNNSIAFEKGKNLLFLQEDNQLVGMKII